MSTNDLINRIGFIRVINRVWNEHGEAIKKSLGQCDIENILPSLGQNGTYFNATDVILRHPEFERFASAEEYPQYHCDFVFHPDGSVTRGRMVRIDAQPME